MTLAGFMKETYLQLIDQGWALDDIDEMDFFYYMDLLIFKANQKGTKTLYRYGLLKRW